MPDTDALDALLNLLAETPSSYLASSRDLLANLRAYLAALVACPYSGDLLVGDWPLELGSALTGIPFTSEFLLRADAHPFLSALRWHLQVQEGKFEQSSYDLWMSLDESLRVPAMWHLYPFKANDGQQQINGDEAAFAAAAFAALLRVLSPRRVFAWSKEVSDFLHVHFPGLQVIRLCVHGTSWHEMARRLELEWHGIADRERRLVEPPDRSKITPLIYLDVIPKKTAAAVRGISPEKTRKRGVAAAATLDERGRLCLFRPGQSSLLAEMLQQARGVVGYNCLDFDYELIRGETRFKRPPTLDLFEVISEANGRRASFQAVVQETLGVQPGPGGVDVQAAALAHDWESVSIALESKLRLMAQLHEQLPTLLPRLHKEER